MTRHKHAHIGLGTPSPLDHWINATLRMLAMLVLHVASTLQMIRRREVVNVTQPTPADLPQANTDTQPKETQTVATSDPAHPCAHLTACHPGNAKRYPGPIVRARHTINGSRRSLRSAWMTIVDEAEAQQHARSILIAPPHLRSSRRKSGPRGGLFRYALLWFPAFTGTSGDLITS